MFGVMRDARLHGLDGIRGLAALGVLLHHVWWYEDASAPASPTFGAPLLDNALAHLRLGVTVFFVLSGFLLYAPFVRASLTGSPGPSLRRYATARLLRIAPAYWLALTVVTLVLFRDLLATDPGAVVRTFLFLQYYVDTPSIIVPAWTLCIEVAFYLCLPVLAALIHRWARGAGSMRGRALRQGGALALVAAGGLGYRLLRFDGVVPPTNLLAFVDEFVPGMLLAVAWEYRRATGRALFRAALAPVVALAGLAVTILVTLASVDSVDHVTVVNIVSVPYEFAVACGFSLVLAALLAAPEGRAARLLESRLLAGLGAVSYAFYLWHQPVLNAFRDWGLLLPNEPRFYAANVLFVAVPSLALAALSWRLVEKPVLALKRRPRKPVPIPAVAAPAAVEPA